MTKIGFIGVGNMGGPMVVNLIGAGHAVTAVDPVAAALEKARAAGAEVAASAGQAAAAGEIVISMLPAGAHVREVYLGEGGVIAAARAGALFIDCSTIDVETARAVNSAAADAGFKAGHDLGGLQGMPISVKDLYGVKGWPTFAGTPKAWPEKWSKDGPVIAALGGQLGVIVGAADELSTALVLARRLLAPLVVDEEELSRECAIMRHELAELDSASLLSSAAWMSAFGERGLDPHGSLDAMAAAE